MKSIKAQLASVFDNTLISNAGKSDSGVAVKVLLSTSIRGQRRSRSTPAGQANAAGQPCAVLTWMTSKSSDMTNYQMFNAATNWFKGDEARAMWVKPDVLHYRR